MAVSKDVQLLEQWARKNGRPLVEQVTNLKEHIFPAHTLVGATGLIYFEPDATGAIIALHIPNLDRLRSMPPLTFASLTHLSITRGEVPLQYLSTLTNLQALSLFRAHISDLTPLAALTQLQTLYLVGNQISDLTPLAELTQLQELYLSGNQISDLALLAELTQLQTLHLRNSQISDLTPLAELNQLQTLDLTNNQISDLTPLAELNQLQTLDLTNNQISDLAPLAELTQLQTLHLRNNQISDLTPLAEFTQLQKLYLDGNQISDLAPLAKLTQLQTLHLRKNPVKDISPLLPLWQQMINQPKRKGGVSHLNTDERSIAIAGFVFDRTTPNLPPLHIAQQGLEGIVAFLKAMAREGEGKPLNEAKVLLVGYGSAGKTSLVKRLLGQAFAHGQPQTHGIQIQDWPIMTPEEEGLITHLWDFGGQEIMHATHQFFLTERSCYILVLDGRQDERPEYWLKHIESFGGSSPILVVLNKYDENPHYDLNYTDLQQKYPNIAGFHRVSCSTGHGIDDFRQVLKEALAKLTIRKEVLPASWIAVKEWVADMKEQAKKDYIDIAELRAVFAQEGVDDAAAQETVIRLLQDLGLAFRFNSGGSTLIFNPKWLTHAVYRVINAARVAAQKGQVCLSDLPAILEAKEEGDFVYEPLHYPYIMGQMEAFQLCYGLAEREQEQKRWVLPDLLPRTSPSYEPPALPSTAFYYQYDFLPKSIFPRLLVQHHKALKDDLQWRTGCVLTHGAATAEVITDHEARTVYVTVWGAEQADRVAYLKQLWQTLEALHGGFSPIFQKNVTPMVQVPGYKGAALPLPELLDSLAMGMPALKVPGHKAVVKIAELLDGLGYVPETDEGLLPDIADLGEE